MRQPDDIDQLEQEYWEDIAEAEGLWDEEVRNEQLQFEEQQ